MLFGKNSVDNVVAVFTKAITDLESIKTENKSTIDANGTKIHKLNEENIIANGESDRATSIIAKLTDLVK